jgi:multiple sugar transport system ATP-binding protein
MIAGLETVSDGAILFDGAPVAHLEPKDRDIAMVFQSYALYPHMTVRGNLAFSLKMKGVPRAEREGLVRRAAEMLGIDGLLHRKPRELSGGQRQRVAMGRALVREPRAFLLDEPLSNLDAALRAQMRIELKRIHQRLKTTIVYVTHDQIEAMTLADRIVVMRDGRIEQVGDPMSVYQAPVNKFVAGFIGSPRMNFIPAQLFDDLGTLKARLPSGEALRLPADRAAAYRLLIGVPVDLGIRPEHLTDRPEFTGGPAGDDSQVFEGVVDVVEPMGATSLITFTLADGVYNAIGEAGLVRRPGERLRLSAQLRHMHLIDSRTEQVVPASPDSAARHEQRRKVAI